MKLKNKKIITKRGKDKNMKKLSLITLVTVTFLLTGCDKYSEYRNLTVDDYIQDQELMNQVHHQCVNGEIKDFDICETVIKALNSNHNAW